MTKKTPWLLMISLALPVICAVTLALVWKGQLVLDALQVALKMVVIP